jgi:WD40 repeat protein
MSSGGATPMTVGEEIDSKSKTIADTTMKKKNETLAPNDNNDNEEQHSNDYEWKLVSLISGELTRTIRHVTFAPTSSSTIICPPILASGSFDGKVFIWEAYPSNGSNDDDEYTNESRMQLDNDSNDNGKYVYEFDAIAELEGHESEVKCLAWNSAGSLLASCGRDKTIWLWECYLPGTVGGAGCTTITNSSKGETTTLDGGEFECLSVLQGHTGDIKCITFGPSHSQFGDGTEVLYSSSYDDTIKIWAEECDEWYCVMTLDTSVHTSTIWCITLSPGGVRLFSGSEDGSMAIWKMYTSNERSKAAATATTTTTNSNNNINSKGGIWNCVGKLPMAHSGYAVMSIDVASTRAGHGRIVSCGGDNRINIYREEKAAALPSSEMLNVVTAPKFALEVVVDDAHDGDVNCVKWHPIDGTCLVSCGDDGAVRLWRYHL